MIRLCLTLLIVLLPTTAVHGGHEADLHGNVHKLLTDAGDDAVIKLNQATGTIQLLRTATALPLKGSTAEARALDFLTSYGKAFGVTVPARELDL